MMNPDLTVAAEGELYEDALPLALRCQNEELDEDEEDDADENDREFDEMAHFRCMLPY